ncbi:MAG: alpha amylase C-terminal domain-containing protein, partial [Cyclobacteriaceae bacterium]|nr:alpha amylase C-terminal domain-containing protein [Cyclobacteriaceae bacterium]
GGFEWIDYSDRQNSVIVFMRKGNNKKEKLIAIFNFTPVPLMNYKIGVPAEKGYREIINSDSAKFGGSDVVNKECVMQNEPYHGQEVSLNLSLPPLGLIVLKPV